MHSKHQAHALIKMCAFYESVPINPSLQNVLTVYHVLQHFDLYLLSFSQVCCVCPHISYTVCCKDSQPACVVIKISNQNTKSITVRCFSVTCYIHILHRMIGPCADTMCKDTCIDFSFSQNCTHVDRFEPLKSS